MFPHDPCTAIWHIAIFELVRRGICRYRIFSLSFHSFGRPRECYFYKHQLLTRWRWFYNIIAEGRQNVHNRHRRKITSLTRLWLEPFSSLGSLLTIRWCPENYVIISLTVQELSCWQTDRQSHKQTLLKTIAHSLRYAALVVNIRENLYFTIHNVTVLK